MSTIAQQISLLNIYDAHYKASDLAIEQDEIWSGYGYTKYTFTDKSVLIQSGDQQYALDPDSIESINGYIDFLGKDVVYESTFISNLTSN